MTVFRDAVADMLELRRKAHELFFRSNNTGKGQIMGYVFSSLQLNGQKLQYSLRKPFDLYVKAADIGEWRAAIDAIRTLPEQRAAVIEFPKHRKIFIDGFVFVPAVVA